MSICLQSTDLSYISGSLEEQPWPAHDIARPDQGYDVRQGGVVVSLPCETIGGIHLHGLIKAKA
jgi:hypothetical protein